MSEQEQTFLNKLRNLIWTWIAVTTAGIIMAAVLFYINAESRIKNIEKIQTYKVNTYYFDYYQKMREQQRKYEYQTLEEIKIDVKDLQIDVKDLQIDVKELRRNMN